MPGLIIQQPHENADDQGKEEQVGNDPKERAVGHSLVGVLQAALGIVAGVNLANAVDDGLHAQGGYKGRNLQPGNDHTVDHTEEGRNGYSDQETHNDRQIRHIGEEPCAISHLLEDCSSHAGAQPHQTAGGQVRALGDETAGNTGSDDKPGSDVDDQIFAVVQGPEIGLGETDCQNHNGDDDNDGVVGQKVAYLPGLQRLPGVLRHSDIAACLLCFICHVPRASSYANCVASSRMDSWVAF